MRKLGAILGIGAAMWILYAVQKTMPTYGGITSPIVVSGRAGERLTARNFELTVKDITLARQIKLAAFGNERAYGTSGVWAVVEAEAAARNESITLTSAAWLAPDGIRYTASERISAAPGLLALQRLEPGLPKRALMIFEIPNTEVHGAAILVARSPFQPLDSEMHIKTDIAADMPVRDSISLVRGASLSDWTLRPE